MVGENRREDRKFPNVVLIGFASSGKTATGTALAPLLGYHHVDLDRELEHLFFERTGNTLPCREIYRTQGEEVFTDVENAALLRLEGRERIVLSTGGRAPTVARNQPILRSIGTIVYLRASLAIIESRMGAKGVPATMAGKDLGEIWRNRDVIYSVIADYIIDNSSLDPGETARMIVEKIKQSENTRE